MTSAGAVLRGRSSIAISGELSPFLTIEDELMLLLAARSTAKEVVS
jgi:hypothetical protein